MSPASLAKNLLLARLPVTELQLLSEYLRPVTLEFKQILYKYRDPIDYVYFPTSGAASAVTIMHDGSAIEVATIGNEGVVGHTIMDGADDLSPNDIIVQVAGDALRMDSADLKRVTERDGLFRLLLLRYNKAFLTQISQSVACNGLHPIQQRCCRWLLITLDRMESNVGAPHP